MKENTNIKHVLISGGTRGIGKAVALNLAKKFPCCFYLIYLQKKESAKQTADELIALGAECELIQANLMYQEEIDYVFESISNITSRLDYFVHCSALTSFRKAMQLKQNHLEMTMNINTSSFLTMVQKAVPLMDSGAIVALSSGGSSRVLPYYTAMGTTKSALESLVRYLAYEVAEQGIRVNCVSAGLIETDSIKSFPDYESMKNVVVNNTPFHRLGSADEIADVVYFLLSEKSSWITGQTIIVDGGFSLT